LLLSASACSVFQDLEYYRAKSDMQDRKLEEAYDSLQKWEDSHIKVSAERDELKKKVLAYEQEFSRLQGSQTDRERSLQQNLNSKELELQNTRDQVKTLQTRLAQATQSSQTQADALGKDKTLLQSKVTALEAQVKTLQQESEGARQQASADRAALDKAVARSKQFEQEAGASKSRVAQLEKEAKSTPRAKSDGASGRATGAASGDGDKAASGDGDGRLAQARQEIEQALAGPIGQNQANVALRDGRVKVRMQSDYLFEPNTVAVSEEARSALAAMGNVLKKYPDYQLHIEGHTDNQPVRDSIFPDNLALSTKRAENVLREMMDAAKLPQKQKKASGSSSWVPIATNDTPEGRQQNRRVEITIMKAE
jgi:flagellar motor protein MotB